MKRLIKKHGRHLLCTLLACIFLSCSSQEVNRERLSDKPHLMTDENGAVWIIEHHIGDLYTVKFLRDSTNAR